MKRKVMTKGSSKCTRLKSLAMGLFKIDLSLCGSLNTAMSFEVNDDLSLLSSSFFFIVELMPSFVINIFLVVIFYFCLFGGQSVHCFVKILVFH